MFKVNNKSTRTMSIMSLCFYYKLWTYFTPYSNVSIVDFGHVNVSWDSAPIYKEEKDISSRNVPAQNLSNARESLCSQNVHSPTFLELPNNLLYWFSSIKWIKNLTKTSFLTVKRNNGTIGSLPWFYFWFFSHVFL